MTRIHSVVTILAAASICTLGGAAASKVVVPKAGVAILVNPSDSHISIDTIDGERKGVKASGTYELKPGVHTLRVHYFYRRGNSEWTSNDFLDYSFVAPEGTVLRVVCDETRSGEKGTWKMWIQDTATGMDIRKQQQAADAQQKVAAAQEQAAEHEIQAKQEFETALRKAEQGIVESMYDVGLLYDRGEGVPANPGESINWFKRASERGHATAQFMLGLNYHLGQGVPQNHEEAFVWLSLSARFGDESAPYFRDESEKELAPEVLARAKARVIQLEAGIRANLPKS
jgi:hypothetical protein